MFDEHDAFMRGVAQFNRREFFDAHDTWETLWQEAKGADAQFLQGLIQLAVAYYHAENGKFHAAYSLMSRALPRLRASDEPLARIDMHKLIEAGEMHRGLFEQNATGDLFPFDEKQIPEITIQTSPIHLTYHGDPLWQS